MRIHLDGYGDIIYFYLEAFPVELPTNRQTIQASHFHVARRPACQPFPPRTTTVEVEVPPKVKKSSIRPKGDQWITFRTARLCVSLRYKLFTVHTIVL